MMLLQSSALPSTTGHPVQLLKKGFHEEDIWCTLGASCPRETLWELVDHNFVSRLRFSIKKGKKKEKKKNLSPRSCALRVFFLRHTDWAKPVKTEPTLKSKNHKESLVNDGNRTFLH